MPAVNHQSNQFMRRRFLTAIMILFACSAFCQAAFRRNIIYPELGGTALSLSLNYERQLKDAPGPGIHIGIGWGDIKPTIAMELLNLWNLKKSKSFIEAGAGITLAGKDMLDENYIDGNSPYVPAFLPSIGFRHQTNYGLMWRIRYAPMFCRYRNYFYTPGFAIGWQF
jgi:hypothetical protein